MYQNMERTCTCKAYQVTVFAHETIISYVATINQLSCRQLLLGWVLRGLNHSQLKTVGPGDREKITMNKKKFLLLDSVAIVFFLLFF